MKLRALYKRVCLISIQEGTKPSNLPGVASGKELRKEVLAEGGFELQISDERHIHLLGLLRRLLDL